MDRLPGAAVFATILVLRLSVPLAATLTMAHMLRRLLAGWQTGVQSTAQAKRH